MRNLHFGECSNDKVFQYAENKEDLKELGDSTLVIVGEGQPIVGINYMCAFYVSRKENKKPKLSATNDSSFNRGFIPPARKKRENDPGKYNYNYGSDKIIFQAPTDNPFKAVRQIEEVPMPRVARYKTTHDDNGDR